MSITAIVENGMVKLPASVPNGTEVEIILSNRESDPTLLEVFKDFVGCFDGPPDMAAEHDHYAHGAPRRHER